MTATSTSVLTHATLKPWKQLQSTRQMASSSSWTIALMGSMQRLSACTPSLTRKVDISLSSRWKFAHNSLKITSQLRSWCASQFHAQARMWHMNCRRVCKGNRLSISHKSRSQSGRSRSSRGAMSTCATQGSHFVKRLQRRAGRRSAQSQWASRSPCTMSHA